MSKTEKHQLVIIGAGPGGYRAAFMAADLGLKVTLIDPEINPGGVCLYRGCIPTKALLHLAKIKADAESAGDMGIHFDKVHIKIDKIREWKNEVVKKLTSGLGQLVKARKINYIRGKAKFLDDNRIEITDDDSNKKQIIFENAIISTGASPVTLPNINTSDSRIMHSAESLNLEDMPNKLLVIGGSYIGLEMSSIYHALGSQVTLVELTKDLMPGTDSDLVKEYKKASKHTFQQLLLQTKVKNIKAKKDSLEVEMENEQGENDKKTFDKILVAIGQKPNTTEIGLENTGIKTNEKGFIQVNEKQQTAQKNIYAIGDVTGPPLLAHKASYEGKVAAEVISGKKAVNDAKALPSVIYTEPEIATCGLTEKEAKDKGISFKVEKFNWSASGRAVAMNAEKGFTKLLIDSNNGRILGAGIVGKNAGDLIAELVLAIEMGATAEDLALTIHPHPTLSETIMEAAEMFYGTPAHTFVKSKQQK
ncbi:dihydrolipoyl dehydrogenase [Draconibacterium halophilum]|uniref:Dihydrolipoyl dehydrogenase n=1 Tax=Draconibacterium halophilum TaxID=2706887 RepID=A0A6C0RGZ1_9BACT|nr:dihydrolipoyl dehydrogenase [Draconibacterium halophilum]QIA09102.1 dihydrolipoyl dehydrogenase [Draconibacterium halophilum]